MPNHWEVKLKHHVFIFVLAVSLFFSLPVYASETKQKDQKYPTGIASIKLGDSKKTVYEKIKASDDIKTKSREFTDWLGSGGFGYSCVHSIKDEDKINLFDREFNIEWNFSKRGKLYSIQMVAPTSKEITPRMEHGKILQFCELVIDQYSYKYGEPAKVNLWAFVDLPKNGVSGVEVAEWNFPNDVHLFITLHRYPFTTEVIKANAVYISIILRDNKEYIKVEKDIQNEKLNNKENQLRMHKKSRDLL